MTKHEKAAPIVPKKHHVGEIEGAAGGALAGAAIGALAGPPGAAAGAAIGAIAGALAGNAVDDEDVAVAKAVRENDRAMGVDGGDIGAPNLEHPKAKVGAYSGGTTAGSGGDGGGGDAEGPMQTPE